MSSRFHLILERYGWTDGQTDGQNSYINIVLMHDKNKSTQRVQISANAKISTKSDPGFESGFSD